MRNINLKDTPIRMVRVEDGYVIVRTDNKTCLYKETFYNDRAQVFQAYDKIYLLIKSDGSIDQVFHPASRSVDLIIGRKENGIIVCAIVGVQWHMPMGFSQYVKAIFNPIPTVLIPDPNWFTDES